LLNNTMNQSRNLTEYDSNYSTCYGVTGIATDLWNSGNNNTYFEYNTTLSCNYLGCPTISNLRNVSTTNNESYISFNCSESCNYTIILLNNSDRNVTVDSSNNNTFNPYHNVLWVNLTNGTTYYINLTVWDDYNCSVSNNTFNFTTGQPTTILPTFPLSIYDFYMESIILNWSDVNETALSFSSCNGTITDCDVSTDNSTWIDITSTRYSGCIDEIFMMSNIENLDDDTLYYVRCKNDTTDWNYLFQRTKGARENDIYFVYITILGTFILFLWFGYHTKDWVFHILASLLLGSTAVFLFNNQFLNLTDVFLKNGLIIILIGISFYYILIPSIKIYQEWGD